MNIQQLKETIIPPLATFCGVPIVEADQVIEKLSYPHATFKVTSPYLKDNGQAEETVHDAVNGYQLRYTESYKVVISFTAYSLDIDESLDLAQKIRDWFAFYGTDVLESNNIAVVNQTDIQNRDTFIVDDYERRNGFDVVLRVTRELYKDISWIEQTEINGIIIKGGIE